MTTRVLILYYSVGGHVETLAEAFAEGARGVPETEVALRRVPELDATRKSPAKSEQKASLATVDELPEYDAIIIGAPTRYGSMAGPMRSFLDQTGGLWQKGALEGKVGSAFTSTATQHGGQELTLQSIITNLLHFGMIVVGLPYSAKEQMTLDEITGGSPYGATTIAGGKGEREPSKNELKLARFQGRHVAEIARRLKER